MSGVLVGVLIARSKPQEAASSDTMTCIDRCTRPPRLIIIATLLSVIAFSLPVHATPITKRRSRRNLQFTTTTNSADDAIESYKLLHQKGNNETLSSSAVSVTETTSSNGELICTPMEECEVCPHKWKQMLEKDDEKVKGEFESCTKYGRRQEFECTVLLQGELCVVCIVFVEGNIMRPLFVLRWLYSSPSHQP